MENLEQKMTLNLNKRSLKIVRLYIIALLCIALFFYLENSVLIPDLVERMSKFRHKGFPTFFLTGLFKYGLLIVGVGIIIILTFLLISQRIKRNT